jgi:hypothetical protein
LDPVMRAAEDDPGWQVLSNAVPVIETRRRKGGVFGQCRC